MQNDFMLFDNKAFMSNIPINENKFTKYIGLFLVVTFISKKILFRIVWCILKSPASKRGEDKKLVFFADHETSISFIKQLVSKYRVTPERERS